MFRIGRRRRAVVKVKSRQYHRGQTLRISLSTPKLSSLSIAAWAIDLQ